MIITTTEHLDQEYTILGIVEGNVTQARHIGRDILAGLKTIVGGEIKSYTELMSTAREKARARMVEEAEKQGADAVVNMRYATADVMQGVAEILAYGTAVKFK